MRHWCETLNDGQVCLSVRLWGFCLKSQGHVGEETQFVKCLSPILCLFYSDVSPIEFSGAQSQVNVPRSETLWSVV